MVPTAAVVSGEAVVGGEAVVVGTLLSVLAHPAPATIAIAIATHH
ncbi:MAG: hypothetical protein OES57_09750 [Acidimicrobiia bacterium]|nr:hypothetical protein [Acidimicrobiia bacterium]